MQDQNSPLIDEPNLSIRSYNYLWRSGLRTVAQVAAPSDEELLTIHQLGQKALTDIHEKLAAVMHSRGKSPLTSFTLCPFLLLP
jgi:DNA-directed RNA polymerase alpha subunit